MGMRIAVLMGIINLDNQQKIIKGMIDAGKETDSHLYIFTNYVGSTDDEDDVRGAYRIMDLPDFSKFDAAILVVNTINYPPALDRVLEAVKKSNIPTITIDRHIDGMGCVGMSGYEAGYELVEHFVTVHNADEIHYVRGPIGNKDADNRYQAYCDVLEKYHIPYKKENIFEGNFSNASGRKAVHYFLKDGKCPKCIICANDNMAMGVYEVLAKKGYRVPEDVMLAGFEYTELSKLNNPSITSINKNRYEVGYRSVHEAINLINGKEPECHMIPCKLEKGGSCGCGTANALAAHRAAGIYKGFHMRSFILLIISFGSYAQNTRLLIQS